MNTEKRYAGSNNKRNKRNRQRKDKSHLFSPQCDMKKHPKIRVLAWGKNMEFCPIIITKSNSLATTKHYILARLQNNSHSVPFSAHPLKYSSLSEKPWCSYSALRCAKTGPLNNNTSSFNPLCNLLHIMSC